MQDELARMMLLYAGESESAIQLAPEEEAEAAADRRDFAADEDVRAIFAKYRR